MRNNGPVDKNNWPRTYHDWPGGQLASQLYKTLRVYIYKLATNTGHSSSGRKWPQ